MDLAVRGRGHVEPNPLVGCVIVRDGRTIGEGFHQRFGEAHAEPSALADAGDAKSATAYVTLEPCCHTNKKTPPCVPRLITAKVGRVVVGCLDPDPNVSGEGVRQLRAAGIEVTAGVLEAEAKQLIAPFFARVRLRRPYVTLKWAVSADGKVAGRQGRPVRITGAAATAAVMALRGRCDAVAVGTNTLLNDDPLLTARTPDPPREPVRVVFSNSLTLGERRRLFATPESGPVLVYTVEREGQAADAPPGVEVIALPGHDNGRGGVRFSMVDAYADLARRGVTHLLVEPGPKLAAELIERQQADRAWVIRGQAEIGDDGLPAPACPWPVMTTRNLDGDVLAEHLNSASDAFFAAAPSPDLILTGL